MVGSGSLSGGRSVLCQGRDAARVGAVHGRVVEEVGPARLLRAAVGEVRDLLEADDHRGQELEIIPLLGAKAVDVTADSITLEATGSPE